MAIFRSVLFLLLTNLELASTLIIFESPIDTILGNSVYLWVMQEPWGNFSIIWTVNSTTLIVKAEGGDVTYSAPYEDRAKLFTNNATLRLDNATLKDSGVYKVELVNTTIGVQSTAEITLRVHRPPLGQIMCDAEDRENQLNLSCSWVAGLPQTAIELNVGSISLTGSNRPHYTIEKKDINPSMELQCTGQHLNASQTCRLVLDEPQFSALSNPRLKVAPNASVTLQVSLTKRLRYSATELLPV
ncbi:V-set and immunoglobulin domain-containing protein 10-like [Heterodontus francisci]|uniref:V-set and immunoglobulin domain-containing protein 10-like n=1 Tax=Heterodontus francisci TaxID=7792 RepID=UPI00355B22D4